MADFFTVHPRRPHSQRGGGGFELEVSMNIQTPTVFFSMDQCARRLKRSPCALCRYYCAGIHPPEYWFDRGGEPFFDEDALPQWAAIMKGVVLDK
jgi:hypothetical protein